MWLVTGNAGLCPSADLNVIRTQKLNPRVMPILISAFSLAECVLERA